MISTLSKSLMALALLTSGSFAMATGLSDLKAGDILVAQDSVSGKDCEIKVTAMGDDSISLILTIGGKVAPELVAKKVFSVKENYVGTYTKTPKIDPADGSVYSDDIEGSLNRNRLTGLARFQVQRMVWGEHSYTPFDPHISCDGLELRK